MNDPKMNIPQNRVLFDDVIKYAVPDIEPGEEDEETNKKPKLKLTVDEEMEAEIKKIRNRMRRAMPKVKE